MSERDELTRAIELQTAILVRNLEMIRRRGDFYREVDRAGYLLLRTLDSSGPSEIGALSEALGLDPSTVGRQVNTLVAGGYATKAADPADRRRAVVTPTPAGVAAAAAVRERRLAGTTTLIADWPVSEIADLLTAFTHYNHAIADHYLRGSAPTSGEDTT